MTCHEAQTKVDELVDGSLAGWHRDEFERHLLTCSECRSYLQWVRWLSTAARALPDLRADRDLWPGIAKAVSVAAPAPRVVAFPRPATSPSLAAQVVWRAIPFPGEKAVSVTQGRILSAAALVLALLALSSALILNSGVSDSSETWAVSWSSPSNPGAGRDTERRLGVGRFLETDANSVAHIQVASIGHVEVRPNSRVRLVGTRSDEHRLALEKGAISALILAPPRLFFVETPSALAVDLGCSYELTVDESGNGTLSVTSGWVSLEYAGRQSLVPAGAVCASRRGQGPGTPYFSDASPAFQSVLKEVDAGKADTATIEALFAAARLRDTLSVWHLFPRLDARSRAILFDRLSAMAAAPAGVTREGITRLDSTMLERWKDGLQESWY